MLKMTTARHETIENEGHRQRWLITAHCSGTALTCRAGNGQSNLEPIYTLAMDVPSYWSWATFIRDANRTGFEYVDGVFLRVKQEEHEDG